MRNGSDNEFSNASPIPGLNWLIVGLFIALTTLILVGAFA
jgi:hypothetical protein